MVVRPGPGWSVADVAVGWIRALARMVEVVDFRWDQVVAFHGSRLPLLSSNDVTLLASDVLLSRVLTTAPDVIVVVHGGEVPPATYAELRRHATVVLVHTESPYEDDRIASMHWCADVHLVNDPSGVERLTAAGAMAAYAHQAHDPAVHFDDGRARSLPLVFVGSGFAGRRAFLERLERRLPAGCDLHLGGTWSVDRRRRLDRCVRDDWPRPMPNTETAEVYRTARLGLNLYRLDHLERPELACGWSMGPREVEMAACGLWFARMPRPEGDQVLSMLPTFDDVDECVEVLAWAWAHPDAVAAAASAARKAVAGRTFDALASGLLGLLEAKELVAA
jgi:hypothetical protein